MGRTPLAILNLLSNPARAFVSIAGVSFALMLIFIQLGFRGAVADTATIVYGRLDFDLLIRSPGYIHLYDPKNIERSWLYQVRSHPDVVSAKAFWIMLNKWRSDEGEPVRAIGMMASEFGLNPTTIAELDHLLPKLTSPDFALIDRDSRKEFGPVDGKRFGILDAGAEKELGDRKTKIVGTFLIGTGLATNGATFVNEVGFAMRANFDARSQVNLGLVRLKPGVDSKRCAVELKEFLAKSDSRSKYSVEILTRKEAMDFEHRRWLQETPIGIIFTTGVFLAFLVGSAIVYMVLSQDVTNRLPEYATLKAMGYSPLFVAGVVLRQAWMLSFAGFFPAWAMAEVTYRITAYFAEIPMSMTPWRIVLVLALSISMCSISGLGAIRKLWQAEPASLF